MILSDESRRQLRDSPYLRGAVLPAPVGLIVAEAAGTANAMTVSLYSEVAHYPTSMWVAVSPRSHTHGILLETGKFSFITLHSRQAVIAAACGTTSGRDAPKAGLLDLYRHGEGFLFLDDAMASTACVVDRHHTVGDHTLFICRMLSGDVTSRGTSERQLLLSDLQAA